MVTIHDAAPFSVPHAHSRKFRIWYRTMFRQLGRRVLRIATVSDFAAEELAARAGILRSKITRIYPGHQHVWNVQADLRILEEHGLTGIPFLLTVGSKSPHKNFRALVHALEMLGTTDHILVIVGGASPNVHASDPDIGLPEGVRHVGAVSDEGLRALYEHAAGYVHPAYYEGFGLPPLEAMALGCPVICSGVASLPEVCGDAALYFDPHDPADISSKLRRFINDPDLRAGLRVKGLARANRFDWDACAGEILRIAHAELGKIAEAGPARFQR